MYMCECGTFHKRIVKTCLLLVLSRKGHLETLVSDWPDSR